MIHLEILCFVYQWYHKLSPSCFVDYFNPVSSIHSIIHVNHKNDSLFVDRFIPLNTAFGLFVTLVPTFGILYLLMLSRKSSRFPVFAKYQEFYD